MAKSVKLKNNYLIDSTGIVHEKGLLSTLLNSILTKINAEKTIKELTLPSVALTTITKYTLLEYTIEEAGTYLITGYSPLNHYGQTGRELNLFLKKNDEDFFISVNVQNGEWTITVPISAMQTFKAGDVLTAVVTNNGAKNWTHGVGKLQLVKL